jgi:pimeloyl-ACP methyl ester carboxylesterase
VKPLFFGSSDRRLFGVHHPPTATSSFRHAVLLCYPGAQEYNGAHWVFRRLAGMLARAGHHVLRFDYFGTGDSAGEGIDGRPNIWVENIVEAAAELREISNARSVSLIGMRLGAALALTASAASVRPRRLILWEPVVSGREYLRELESSDAMRHQWLLHGSRVKGLPDELLGYRVPPELRYALMEVDACSGPPPQAERILIVTENARAEHEKLHGHLARSVPVTLKVVKEEGGVAQSGNREKARLSNSVLTEMVAEMSMEGG